MKPVNARVGLVVRGAVAALEASRQRIDDLNVYPVPDGDTGTNMTQTVRRVLDDLGRLEGPATPRQLAEGIARSALVGARGNSGVILSQIIRGFVSALGDAGPFDAAALARAMRGASDAGYGAVRAPVEGTILTVIREMAEEAEDATRETVDAALDRVVRRGMDALERTPTMLQKLADAGVVDAGGAGLMELMRGAVAAMRGGQVESAPVASAGPVLDGHGDDEESQYRYCTGFLVLSDAGTLVADRLHALLEPLGDSLLVVGDGSALRVHVHTDDPGAALSVGVAHGGLSGVEIADMHAQVLERRERLRATGEAPSRRRCDVVAVVQGEGNEALARARGARGIVQGGQTLNPSTEQLLEAIDGCSADEVVLLPNNDNIVMAARSAASIAQRPVVVVETTSIPAGMVALEAYAAGLSAEENAAAMRASLGRVATGAVTRASRDARVDGVPVAKGAWMGLVDGRLVATSTLLGEVCSRMASSMLTPDRRSLLVLHGEADVAPVEVDEAIERVSSAFPGVRVERLEGGQAHYPLLFAAQPLERRLDATTTAIVFDSTADIDVNRAAHPSWRMVPLTVRFGDEEFQDGVTLSGGEFYRRLRSTPVMPRTSAPAPGVLEAAYRELLEHYRDVVSLHISGKLSATVESARTGAAPLGDRVLVFDTMAASGLLAIVVDAVQRMLDAGTTVTAVQEFVSSIPARSGIAFSLDTLEFLQRNGRIGRGQALLGGFLRVRPILALTNGEVDAVRRVRGRRAAIPALVEHTLRRSAGFDQIDVAILHAASPEEAVRLEHAVREARGGIVSVRTVEIGAVVGAHIGPGGLGVAFLAR